MSNQFDDLTGCFETLKAEERALEAYPVCMVRRRYDWISRSDDPYDSNLHERYVYQRGYEQAEKDLALTWEDIKRIVEIADHLCPYTTKDIAEFQAEFQTEESYYREVLKRFNQKEQS